MEKNWELLLKTEDQCEGLIAEAVSQSAHLVERRHQEADAEVEKIRSEYKVMLDKARDEAEQSIRQLQDHLQDGQQDMKTHAAEQVLMHKEEIVELLLSAVLNVSPS
jgi:F0F1-type ATP synthase membrane subunit b/b'